LKDLKHAATYTQSILIEKSSNWPPQTPENRRKKFPPVNPFRRSAGQETVQNELDFTSKNYHSGSDSSRSLSTDARLQATPVEQTPSEV